MSHLAIIARPVSQQADAHLLLCRDGKLTKFFFHKDRPIQIAVDHSVRYCTGWYDIATHTNHPCEANSVVHGNQTDCWPCRRKTGFHPAFYNISDISEKQRLYNQGPHSVYISYFGNGLAKVGIMSDSRGLERLYEQGALFYIIVAHCANAITAHSIERRLIQKGLKDSVQNRQKAAVLKSALNIQQEQNTFAKLLDSVGHSGSPIVNNSNVYFFGEYPQKPVEEFAPRAAVSGTVRGVVGRYLILENMQRLYGFWLNDLSGYLVRFGTTIQKIAPQPQQRSLL